MPDTGKIDRLYFGKVLRWLLIGGLYLVSAALFIWALVDVSVDTLGGKDEIERMRWHGLFFFVFATGLFVGVGWLVRLPLPMRRHRAFVKFVRAFWLVVLGALIGYSFGFYCGTRYIFNGRMTTIGSYRQMMHAVQIYSSEYSNHTTTVTDTSTNQPVAKP